MNARELIEADCKCDRCGCDLPADSGPSVHVCPCGWGCSKIQERDDIKSLPLSREAKAYARRSGMKALKRQPREFQKVNHQIMNPTRKSRKFKNRDEGNGSKTDGATTSVPKSMKF